MRLHPFSIVFIVIVLTCGAAAQQNYVARYDAFAGYSYLATSNMNLAQRGRNAEFGVNVNRWLAIGGDYSIFNGHSTLVPADLTDALQSQLGALVPPGTPVSVPYEAVTQTFSAGPQVNIRRWRPVTFFVRPALGILHEKVTAKPQNALSTAIVAALVPAGKKSDTVLFYGVGGGLDLNVSKHVAIRMAADFVHTNLFDGFLREGRNSVRMSVGPTLRWGRNVE